MWSYDAVLRTFQMTLVLFRLMSSIAKITNEYTLQNLPSSRYMYTPFVNITCKVILIQTVSPQTCYRSGSEYVYGQPQTC